MCFRRSHRVRRFGRPRRIMEERTVNGTGASYTAHEITSDMAVRCLYQMWRPIPHLCPIACRKNHVKHGHFSLAKCRTMVPSSGHMSSHMSFGDVVVLSLFILFFHMLHVCYMFFYFDVSHYHVSLLRPPYPTPMIFSYASHLEDKESFASDTPPPEMEEEEVQPPERPPPEVLG